MYLQLKHQLTTLQTLLRRLNGEQYTQPVGQLSMACIGGHTRHIIEIFQCLLQGYESGMCDYINRERDLRLEQDVAQAILALNRLISYLPAADKPISVRDGMKEAPWVQSSYAREVVYNTEHTIHHLALIKVALHELGLIHLVDQQFGMAYATLLYKESLTTVSCAP